MFESGGQDFRAEDPVYDQRLSAAEGYLELGMPGEALLEIGRVEPEYDHDPDLLKLKVTAHLKLNQWNEGLEASRDLCRVESEEAMGYIHSAYCLHELGKTDEAREILLCGPETLRQEPLYYYNLACYCTGLGEKAVARRHLRTAFTMDESLRKTAAEDEDLRSLGEDITKL